MKVEDLLQRYASGKRDFSWADLSGSDLTGANLAGINLYAANLSQAVLVRANLHGVNLLKANLTGADLTEANLTGANLRKANLTAAKLDEADLEGATLTGAIAPDGQPFLSTPPVLEASESLPEPLPDPLPVPPIDAPSPAQQVSTWTEFRSQLPWATLVSSAIGFGIFGGLLLLHQSTIVSWWVVWAIALLGTVGEANTWLVPLVPALVVVLAAKSVDLGAASIATVTTLWQLFMMVAAVGAVFGCLKLVLGFSWERSVRDTIAVGAGGWIIIQLFVWIISGRWLLGLLFLSAIGFTGMGAIAWLQMQDAGFSRWQIRWTVAIVTAVGLLAGWIVGWATTS